MKAVKGNRVYTITEADVKRFVADGYDVKDDAGNIVAYGAGKMVPISKYVEALRKIEELTAENAMLRKAGAAPAMGEEPIEVPAMGDEPVEAPEEEPKTKSETKSKKK